MNRRALLKVLAVSPLTCIPVMAARPGSWWEIARRDVRLPASRLFMALPPDAPPVRRIRLAAHGCGLWIYGVEGFSAWGGVETIPLKLHVPPGRLSHVFEFRAPVLSLRLTLDVLPFGDGPIEAAVWGETGDVTAVSGTDAIARAMEMQA